MDASKSLVTLVFAATLAGLASAASAQALAGPDAALGPAIWRSAGAPEIDLYAAHYPYYHGGHYWRYHYRGEYYNYYWRGAYYPYHYYGRYCYRRHYYYGAWRCY